MDVSKTIFYLVISSALHGCIQEFNPQLDTSPVRLVVDGRITDQPGPYVVKLSLTQPFQSGIPDSIITPVRGAQVEIEDNTGTTEMLSEISPGVYATGVSPGSIKGEIGNSYRITIITTSEDVYQSQFQEMIPVPEIDDISFSTIHSGQPIQPVLDNGFVLNVPGRFPNRAFFYIVDVARDFEVDPIYEGVGGWMLGGASDDFFINKLTSNIGLKVSVATADPPVPGNYYRWNVSGIFKVLTRPRDFIVAAFERDADSQAVRPRPDKPFLINIPKECCSECWVSFELLEIALADDKLINGNLFQKDLRTFPVNSFLFQEQFYLMVEQSSLSREAFHFYKALNDQMKNVGNLFDTTPALLTSNVINLSDPQDIVLGYFVISAVSTMSKFVENDIIEKNFDRFYHADDCRELSNHLMLSSVNRPDFWPD